MTRAAMLGLVGSLSLLGLAGCEKPELQGGKALYEHYCLACHGADGDGKFLKGTPSLKKSRHSLTRLRTIMSGHRRPKGEDSRMPVFSHLSSEELNQIAVYLHREIRR